MSVIIDAAPHDLARASGRLASDAEALDRVHRTLGPVEVVDAHDGSRKTSRVLHVVTRGEEHAIVKWHRDAAVYRREAEGLQQAAAALGGDAPRIVTTDEGLRLIVVSRLLGNPVAGTPAEHDPMTHYRAGELLRRLHDSVPSPVHTRFGPLIVSEFERWAARADDLWGERGEAERHRLRTLVADALDLPALPHVPAHRQFHPAHWIADPGEHVRVIDFSDSQFEPWSVDLLWLAGGPWRDAPVLGNAFFEGYGRRLDQTDLIVLTAATAVRGLELLVRGEARGHAAEKHAGRAMLDRLLGATLF